MMEHFRTIERLSLNQATVEQWSLPEALEGCARAGIPFIGLWRHKVSEIGVPRARRLVRDAGLKVSSLCRGGLFPAGNAAERRSRIEDNRRAIDEAAELGTSLLVLVCGADGRDIDGSRRMVEDAVAELVPYARERGVTLGIEPLHPMFAASRSVVVTLDQALTMAERFDPQDVGVVVDVYHVWWDPTIYSQIRRAAGRVLGFHVNDWIEPPPDILAGRGMMGDGVIEIRRLRQAVDRVGYIGPIEVEIFNHTLWSQPGDEVLALVKERFLTHA